MSYNNQVIDKEYRKSQLKVIAGGILLALGIAILVFSLFRFVQLKNNAEHINNLIISDEKDRTNRIAYGDFGGYFQFASYGEELGYYIAYDEDYFYIISIPEKEYDYFESKFSDDSSDLVRFYGRTIAIPEEAKSYAISALNEELGQEYATYSNFEDVFGDLCLACRKESSLKGIDGYFSTSAPQAIISIFLLIIGLIFLLTGITDQKSFSVLKSDNDLFENEIMKEINDPSSRFYQKNHLYLTENYLVSLKGSVSAVAIADIFWAYITRHRTNAIPDYNYLTIATKDGKKILCGNGSTFGKKNKEETENTHDEILNTIAAKNPSIRFGYDQDNIAAYSELLKENKKNQN